MNFHAKRVQRIYLTLILGNTLAASFIWGINTLFLLDAGLSNAQAFAANAFYTVGVVLFEVPTGIVADTLGRRASYLMGTLTLAASTLLYYWLWHTSAPFAWWAVVSALLGLGFTFFSGAVEAWLVDAMNFTRYTGDLDTVFGRGQIVSGIAMLTGSIAGGVVAQTASLGVPYLIRASVLVAMFAVAYWLMKDLGFTPKRSKQPLHEMKKIFRSSLNYGLRNRPVRWVMLAAPFTTGVGFYTFYAMQPYLLELYGQSTAYSVAGLAAAVVAGAQILGGYTGPRLRRLFHRRTSALIAGVVGSACLLVLLALTSTFALALGFLVLWGLIFAAMMPVRQAYLNGLIRSEQRATVLSFDSLIGGSGGVVIQPALGKAADVLSYGSSYLFGAGFQILAAPFLIKSRRENAPADFTAGVPVPSKP